MTEQSWTDSAEGEGQTPKMPEGYHRVKVLKAIRAKKDGTELKSQAGPYLIVVVGNDSGEATASFWVTPKAKWKLARALSRMGVDLKKMDEAGVSIEKFLDGEFAKTQLVGREAWAQVEHDGQYANVEFFSEDEMPAAALKTAMATAPAAAPADDDDGVPF